MGFHVCISMYFVYTGLHSLCIARINSSHCTGSGRCSWSQARLRLLLVSAHSVIILSRLGFCVVYTLALLCDTYAPLSLTCSAFLFTYLLRAASF